MRKPAVIRFGRFGGIRNRLRSRSYTPCILDPSPLSFPQRYSPLPPTQSLYLPPLLGREPLMHKLRFRILFLPRLYCTTHRIRMNWGESGRRVLPLTPFGRSSEPRFQLLLFSRLYARHTVSRRIGGIGWWTSLCLRSWDWGKKAAFGVASGGVNPAYNNRLLRGSLLY